MPSRYWNICFSSGVRGFGFSIAMMLLCDMAMARSIRTGMRSEDGPKAEVVEEAPSVDPVVAFYLGFKKPTFSKLNFYSKFYGQPKWQPTLGANKYYLDFSALKVGLGFGLGLYNTSGTQQKLKDGAVLANATEADFEPVPKAPLKLALFSYALSLETKLGVPSFRYVNFDFSVGYQELYFEEVRSIDHDSSSGTDTQPFVSTGWNNGLVFGAAMNILLNFLDEGAGKSLNRSLGFSNIYMAPFVRKAQKISNNLPGGRKSKKVDFTSGDAVGVAFVFESL